MPGTVTVSANSTTLTIHNIERVGDAEEVVFARANAAWVVQQIQEYVAGKSGDFEAIRGPDTLGLEACGSDWEPNLAISNTRDGEIVGFVLIDWGALPWLEAEIQRAAGLTG